MRIKTLFTLLTALLICAAASAQTYAPIALTGFNTDGIAEDSPAVTHTSGTLDGSYVCYSAHYGTLYGTGVGLPNNGSISATGRSYQLASYTGHNVQYLATGQTDTLTLVSPAAYYAISLLAFSTDGDGTIDVRLLFTDGTSSFHKDVALYDWFYNPGAVISGFDRADRGSGTPDGQTSQPNMYPIDLSLCSDQGKVLRRIIVTNTGNPQSCIFAVSGAAAATFSVSNIQPHCHGATDGQATITTSGGAGSYSYAWSTNPIQTTPTATGLTGGVYYISVTSGATCSFVYADTMPQPAGTPVPVTASADTVCAGTMVVLSTSSAGPYTWSAGGSSSATDTIYAQAGTVYTVTEPISGGCTAVGTAPLYVNTCTGIDALYSDMLTVYPNPAHDKISISVDRNLSNGNIELYDLQGRMIYSRTADMHSDTSVSIDIHNTASGIYLLKLLSTNGQLMKKVLIN